MTSKGSSTPPVGGTGTVGTSSSSHSYFEKQRDLLIQEISNSMDSVVYNLDILNRSLNESIQVGKEFDDVGRLWSNFYDGMSQLKEKQGSVPNASVGHERESNAEANLTNSSENEEAEEGN
ncbi:DASH complex subunit Dad1-domain-containing protein [Scheffersomyces xylosifermentans]|uniref:DASH complex subunit Dad1-domain-containing protein n=1 Tax=Scheffersomyces xylosifermentans TaxID=1304137 RepID=UPI00315D8F2F